MNAGADQSVTHTVVLFADLVDCVGLFQRLGDTRAHEVMRRALEAAAVAVESGGGTVIKTIGDCLMATFPYPDAAVDSSIAVHLAARQVSADGGVTVRFRIGFQCGELIARDNDVFGDAVNLAHRLTEIARAEQIITEAETAAQLTGARVQTAKVFDVIVLKGAAKPATVIKLEWHSEGATQIFDAAATAGAMLKADLRPLRLTFAGTAREFSAREMPVVLGRDLTCHVVIASPRASRDHARISVQRNKFVLTDNSSNGTYIYQGDATATPVFCRRESMPLLGDGWISLGRAELDEFALRFFISLLPTGPG